MLKYGEGFWTSSDMPKRNLDNNKEINHISFLRAGIDPARFQRMENYINGWNCIFNIILIINNLCISNILIFQLDILDKGFGILG